MGKYFSIAELVKSDTAKIKKIDNTPPANLIPNGERLIILLDKIREKWGKPITVSSGYRCKALNAAVGGKITSDHLNFCAADITCNDNKKLWDLIVSMVKNKEIEIDQLIDEKGLRWIHISTRLSGNRNMIFEIK